MHLKYFSEDIDENIDKSLISDINSNFFVESQPYTTERLSEIGGSGYKLITRWVHILEINFNSLQDLKECSDGVKDSYIGMKCVESGTADAIVLAFKLFVDEENIIETFPGSESCWENAVYPIRSHLELQTGTTVVADVRVDKYLHVSLSEDVSVRNYMVEQNDGCVCKEEIECTCPVKGSRITKAEWIEKISSVEISNEETKSIDSERLGKYSSSDGNKDDDSLHIKNVTQEFSSLHTRNLAEEMDFKSPEIKYAEVQLGNSSPEQVKKKINYYFGKQYFYFVKIIKGMPLVAMMFHVCICKYVSKFLLKTTFSRR